jgi:SPP1 gp7 family putative phage head morphogenesis protein
MVLRSNKASKATLSKSMESLTGGITLNFEQTSPELKEIMSATVAENVALISTITGTYLDNVQKSILRSITTGQGLKELIPSVEENLNSFAGDTHRKAINVALDQTRKAYNNINRQRMEKIGQKKFEWVHSGGGQHPRQLHIEMNGNIYSFDDLPIIDKKKGERGIPGQAINCKCTMLPVIEFNEVPNDD